MPVVAGRAGNRDAQLSVLLREGRGRACAEVVPHPGDAERDARDEINRHQSAEERQKHAHLPSSTSFSVKTTG